MTSIHTNTAAIATLGRLRTISNGLDSEQRHISSGLRVENAADNAAYWSIATTMKSDDKSMSATQDALGLGAGVVDVAYSGMTAAIDVMQQVKVKLIAAREPGVDRDKINQDIEELRQQIYSIVDSSSFAGQNWLHRYTDADDADQQIVGSFTRGESGVGVQTINFKRVLEGLPFGTNHLIDEIYHNGLLSNVEYARQLGTATEWSFINGRQHDIHPTFKLDSTTTTEDIDGMISVTERMLADMTASAADLGALAKRISMQDDFVADVRSTLTKGMGKLVDNEMNSSSARLKALQAQQDLGLSALSIANAQSTNILRLYQS